MPTEIARFKEFSGSNSKNLFAQDSQTDYL